MNATRQTERTEDVIIVGGGVAGLSAAIMLGRSLRSTLVVDAGEPRNRFARRMHGVLGQDGTDPLDLLRRGRREAESFGVAFSSGHVERVDADADGVTVELDDGTAHRARALIAASGVVDRLPDVPGLAEHWGSTVLHCPYCHGWEARGSRIGVMYTTPFSAHLAQLARQLSPEVTVWVGDNVPLDPETRAAFVARGMRIVESPIVAVRGVKGGPLTLIDGRGEATERDALFVASVPQPSDGYLAPLDLDRTETPMGSFLRVDAMGATSNPCVYGVGNLVGPQMTVPLAAASGTQAGISINAQFAAADFAAASRA